MRATYEFKATSSDEIDFPKDAIITDVIKQDDDWWEGLYNDKRGFFPRFVFFDPIGFTLLNLAMFASDRTSRSWTQRHCWPTTRKRMHSVIWRRTYWMSSH